MSSGQQLQEMEVGTKQSKTAVNANAKPAMPMEKGATCLSYSTRCHNTFVTSADVPLLNSRKNWMRY